MPQGSLFTEQELNRVRITLHYDDIKGMVRVAVVGESRRGAVLASSSVNCSGVAQCELIPIMLVEVANGFLYRGAREAVVLPAGALRARRKSFTM